MSLYGAILYIVPHIVSQTQKWDFDSEKPQMALKGAIG